PLPRATIVITAPTPMMMPSMVSADRSMLARIDCKATAMVSPSSMLGPCAGGWLGRLLPHAGDGSATGDPIEPLPHVLLRLHQAGARQHQNGIRRGQALQHLAVVEVGEAG